MTNLLKRATSGFIYAVLFITAILYSKESYIVLISLFGFISIREFLNLLKFNNIIIYMLFIGLIYLPFSSLDSSVLIDVLLVLSISGSIQLLVNLFIKKKNYPSNTIQKLDISIRYLLLSFTFLILLPFINGGYEASVILSLIIFIWVNDSFAFFVGKNLGKRKLFESVSPKKTIEGFLGGVFFTLITAFLVSYFCDFLSLTNLLVISLIASILGTIGDLVESKFKRQANTKDSGTIMPGHGGILDRLDSLLFVAPFVYLYIHYLI
ncbi:phosphatidate cytidylyltransferase [Flavobacteriaceae bacterium]|nr:phosphatidate cytidylyltransferase [Flavobacteriaceae bacterium]MDB4025157.1 phosphatidate cytidylyltransferase [Flavobacteriaceae bacterium]MDB4064302.1 phosphatidate cytidylyltransferase [Flavobacteriaceae bacterium]MDB4207363.1 phosphatidate cytidylyltransferase [Flavobacteriaceae bacterium]MDB4236498.1 phosphatidate cytidylyltransferase [Flavobacteriaceae bacterium]|tara:strand:- start:2839 stop:3636 length:798 start_codon:yes stop_codon:yes gene_type:complete